MTVTLLRLSAWLSVLAVFVMTVGPIDLRPVSDVPVNLERLLAFVAVGGLFGAAHPRHLLSIILLVVGVAATFELMQLFIPNRHGHFDDFALKAIGGVAGVLAGSYASRRVGL